MNEMACLKTILGLAVRDGHIGKNPVSSVKMPRVNNRRERVITRDEYARLLSEVSSLDAPHMYPILVLAYETGMRRGEILGLQWADIEKDFATLRLADTKNGTSRVVPLNEAAREALKNWPRRTDTDYLFAGSHGEPFQDCGRAWRTLCSNAGITDIRFHDFRHAFTTRMLEAGVDVRTIMAVTGHKSVAMFQRYSHPTVSRLRQAVESLNEPLTRVKSRDTGLRGGQGDSLSR
jgi:integrase